MPFFETGGGAVRVIGKTSCPIIYPSGGVVETVTATECVLLFNTPRPTNGVSARGGWVVLPQDALYPGSEYRPYWCKPHATNSRLYLYGNAFPGISQWQTSDINLDGAVQGTIFSGGTGFYTNDASISIINAPGLTVGPFDSVSARACITGVVSAGGQYSFNFAFNGQAAAYYASSSSLVEQTYTMTVLGGLRAEGPTSSGAVQMPGTFMSGNGPNGYGGLGEISGAPGSFPFDISADFKASYELSKTAEDFVSIYEYIVFLEKAPYDI